MAEDMNIGVTAPSEETIEVMEEREEAQPVVNESVTEAVETEATPSVETEVEVPTPSVETPQPVVSEEVVTEVEEPRGGKDPDEGETKTKGEGKKEKVYYLANATGYVDRYTEAEYEEAVKAGKQLYLATEEDIDAYNNGKANLSGLPLLTTINRVVNAMNALGCNYNNGVRRFLQDVCAHETHLGTREGSRGEGGAGGARGVMQIQPSTFSSTWREMNERDRNIVRQVAGLDPDYTPKIEDCDDNDLLSASMAIMVMEYGGNEAKRAFHAITDDITDDEIYNNVYKPHYNHPQGKATYSAFMDNIKTYITDATYIGTRATPDNMTAYDVDTETDEAERAIVDDIFSNTTEKEDIKIEGGGKGVEVAVNEEVTEEKDLTLDDKLRASARAIIDAEEEAENIKAGEAQSAEMGGSFLERLGRAVVPMSARGFDILKVGVAEKNIAKTADNAVTAYIESLQESDAFQRAYRENTEYAYYKRSADMIRSLSEEEGFDPQVRGYMLQLAGIYEKASGGEDVNDDIESFYREIAGKKVGEERVEDIIAPIADYVAENMEEGVQALSDAFTERVLDDFWGAFEDKYKTEDNSEWFARNTFFGSIGGSVFKTLLGAGDEDVTRSLAMRSQMDTSFAEENPVAGRDFLSGVGSFLLDSPVFSLGGAVGAGAFNLAMRGVGAVAPRVAVTLSRGATKAGFKAVSTRLLSTSARLGAEQAQRGATYMLSMAKGKWGGLAYNLLQSSVHSAGSFGAYGFASGFSATLAEGGSVTDALEVGAGSGGRQALTGALFGAVGTTLRFAGVGSNLLTRPIEEMFSTATSPFVREYVSRAFQGLGRSAYTLAVDAPLFNLASTLVEEGNLNNYSYTDAVRKDGAMFLALSLTHFGTTFGRETAPYRNELLTHYQNLSKAYEVNDVDLANVKFTGRDYTAGEIYDNRRELMEDTRLPLSTRMKLQLWEGRTPEVPIYDFSEERVLTDGDKVSYWYTERDTWGNVISVEECRSEEEMHTIYDTRTLARTKGEIASYYLEEKRLGLKEGRFTHLARELEDKLLKDEPLTDEEKTEVGEYILRARGEMAEIEREEGCKEQVAFVLGRDKGEIERALEVADRDASEGDRAVKRAYEILHTGEGDFNDVAVVREAITRANTEVSDARRGRRAVESLSPFARALYYNGLTTEEQVREVNRPLISNDGEVHMYVTERGLPLFRVIDEAGVERIRTLDGREVEDVFGAEYVRDNIRYDADAEITMSEGDFIGQIMERRAEASEAMRESVGVDDSAGEDIMVYVAYKDAEGEEKMGLAVRGNYGRDVTLEDGTRVGWDDITTMLELSTPTTEVLEGMQPSVGETERVQQPKREAVTEETPHVEERGVEERVRAQAEEIRRDEKSDTLEEIEGKIEGADRALEETLRDLGEAEERGSEEAIARADERVDNALKERELWEEEKAREIERDPDAYIEKVERGEVKAEDLSEAEARGIFSAERAELLDPTSEKFNPTRYEKITSAMPFEGEAYDYLLSQTTLTETAVRDLEARIEGMREDGNPTTRAIGERLAKDYEPTLEKWREGIEEMRTLRERMESRNPDLLAKGMEVEDKKGKGRERVKKIDATTKKKRGAKKKTEEIQNADNQEITEETKVQSTDNQEITEETETQVVENEKVTSKKGRGKKAQQPNNEEVTERVGEEPLVLPRERHTEEEFNAWWETREGKSVRAQAQYNRKRQYPKEEEGKRIAYVKGRLRERYLRGDFDADFREGLSGDASREFKEKTGISLVWGNEGEFRGDAEAGFFDYERNEIVLNRDAEGGRQQLYTIVHELTHAIGASGEWEGFSSALLKYRYGTDSERKREDREELRDRYRRHGKELTEIQTDRELVAETAGEVLFQDVETLEDFVKRLPQEGEGILKTLRAKAREWLPFIGGGEVERLEGMFDRALKSVRESGERERRVELERAERARAKFLMDEEESGDVLDVFADTDIFSDGYDFRIVKDKEGKNDVKPSFTQRERGQSARVETLKERVREIRARAKDKTEGLKEAVRAIKEDMRENKRLVAEMTQTSQMTEYLSALKEAERGSGEALERALYLIETNTHSVHARALFNGLVKTIREAGKVSNRLTDSGLVRAGRFIDGTYEEGEYIEVGGVSARGVINILNECLSERRTFIENRERLATRLGRDITTIVGDAETETKGLMESVLRHAREEGTEEAWEEYGDLITLQKAVLLADRLFTLRSDMHLFEDIRAREKRAEKDSRRRGSTKTHLRTEEERREASEARRYYEWSAKDAGETLVADAVRLYKDFNDFLKRGREDATTFIRERRERNTENVNRAIEDAMAKRVENAVRQTTDNGRASWLTRVRDALSGRATLAGVLNDISTSAMDNGFLSNLLIKEGDSSMLHAYEREYNVETRAFDAFCESAKRCCEALGVRSGLDPFNKINRRMNAVVEDEEGRLILYQNRHEGEGDVVVWDGSDHKGTTIGQALNIYLTAQQAHGRESLLSERGNDMREEDLERVERLFREGGKYSAYREMMEEIEGAMQRVGADANRVHKRLYGVGFTMEDNYFPITALPKGGTELRQMPSGRGFNIFTPFSLVQRQRGAVTIAYDANPMASAYAYVMNMSHWLSYAECATTANGVVANGAFKTAIEKRFGGDTYKRLYDAMSNALDVQRRTSEDASGFMRWLGRLQSRIQVSKIGLRFLTAFRQLTSLPTYVGYSSNLGYQKNLIKNVINPVAWVKNFRWALENMDVFKIRYTRGDTGLMYLNPDERRVGQSVRTIGDRIRRGTMWLNKVMDAVTIATGSRAVYDYEYGRYKETGLRDEDAHRLAIQNATLEFNLTQQSNLTPFVGKWQRSNDLFSRGVLAFRNATMAYTRKTFNAIEDIRKIHAMGGRGKAYEIRTEREVKRLEEVKGEALTEREREVVRRYVGNQGIMRNVATILGTMSAGALFYLPTLGWKYLWERRNGGQEDEDKALRNLWVGMIQHGVFGSVLDAPIINTIADTLINRSSTLTKNPERAIPDMVMQAFMPLGISDTSTMAGSIYSGVKTWIVGGTKSERREGAWSAGKTLAGAMSAYMFSISPDTIANFYGAVCAFMEGETALGATMLISAPPSIQRLYKKSVEKLSMFEMSEKAQRALKK